MCVYVCVCVCVYVCACVRVCACVCVFVREREKERGANMHCKDTLVVTNPVRLSFLYEIILSMALRSKGCCFIMCVCVCACCVVCVCVRLVVPFD